VTDLVKITETGLGRQHHSFDGLPRRAPHIAPQDRSASTASLSSAGRKSAHRAHLDGLTGATSRRESPGRLHLPTGHETLHLRPQGEVEVALTRRDGLRNDRKIIEPQLATLKMKAPSGPQWIHEIKYDGYRVQLRIDGDDRRA
jgi:hypothetical protein